MITRPLAVPLAAVLSLAALPAMAQVRCPDGADVDTGLRFLVSGGDSEVFRRLPGGVIEATYRSDGTPDSRVLLGQGVYLLELADVEAGKPVAGSRTTYAYPLPPDRMPVPSAGGTWGVKVAVFDGKSLTSEMHDYRFGALTRLTLGACGYDMIPITITYPDGDETSTDTLYYMPGLGISYLSATQSGDTTERYSYYAIEVLP